MNTMELIRLLGERMVKVETKMDLIFWMIMIVLGFLITQFAGALWKKAVIPNGNGKTRRK